MTKDTSRIGGIGKHMVNFRRWRLLVGFIIKILNTQEEWLTITQDFEAMWNFPNCVGSMDGKYIILQAPINSGSEYYNYKGFYSIVLFALVDANYNVIFFDIGCQGRISNGGIFQNCEFHRRIAANVLNLPPAKALPGRQNNTPHVFIAFSLTERIMKPYSGAHPKGSVERIFYYRLSRARRVLENVFGII